MSFHGLPCWFELSVPDPDAAEVFYDAALGWAWSRVDMGAFDYHLAQMGEVLVAGGFPLAACPPGTPPNWMIYIAVDDCDASAAQAVALGGKIWKDPDDIPGTGRFAIFSAIRKARSLVSCSRCRWTLPARAAHLIRKRWAMVTGSS